MTKSINTCVFFYETAVKLAKSNWVNAPEGSIFVVTNNDTRSTPRPFFYVLINRTLTSYDQFGFFGEAFDHFEDHEVIAQITVPKMIYIQNLTKDEKDTYGPVIKSVIYDAIKNGAIPPHAVIPSWIRNTDFTPPKKFNAIYFPDTNPTLPRYAVLCMLKARAKNTNPHKSPLYNAEYPVFTHTRSKTAPHLLRRTYNTE